MEHVSSVKILSAPGLDIFSQFHSDPSNACQDIKTKQKPTA